MVGGEAMNTEFVWSGDDPQRYPAVTAYLSTADDVERRLAAGPDFSTVAVCEFCGVRSAVGERLVRASFDRIVGHLMSVRDKQRVRAESAWVYYMRGGGFPAGAD